MKTNLLLTRPIAPSKVILTEYIDKIIESGIYTNHGELVLLLESLIKEKLGTPHASLINNGTIALMIACKALNLTGDVIVTPFTFPATITALMWIGLNPVFVDIDKTLNIDVTKIESAITSKTSAIMGVHLFGEPCDVIEIQKIANKHGLKVIYDAAHAFNESIIVNGTSVGIGAYGDISMFSLHATKLLHTGEGGVLTTKDENINKRIYLLKSFGIENETTISTCGINGKMSEINAAVGLAVLPKVNDEIKRRKELFSIYIEKINECKGITIPYKRTDVIYNYQYFPLIIDKDIYQVSRDEVYNKLKKQNIHSRRYFYPLCSNLNYCSTNLTKNNVPFANKMAESVLVLPLFGEMAEENIIEICAVFTNQTFR